MKTQSVSNGSWLPLVEAGPQGDKKITRGDLDSIAANFAASRDRKLPVVFGNPSSAAPPVLAQIDDMQRSGDILSGKLSKVDPRMERLVSAGLLKKRMLQIKGHGMPEGPSITGIGLVHQKYGINSILTDAPGTEEELNRLCETSGDMSAESQFAEYGPSGSSVADAVNRLRRAGRWLPEFGGMGMKPLLNAIARCGTVEFEEGARREKVPAIEIFVSCLESLLPVGSARSLRSFQLSELAKKRAAERSISYGDALTQVAADHPELSGASESTHCIDVNGERLTALAKDLSDSKALSFGEALRRVASENPQLTRPRFEAREMDSGGCMRDRNGERLTSLARERAQRSSISFCEALGHVAAERPELTIPRFESE